MKRLILTTLCGALLLSNSFGQILDQSNTGSVGSGWVVNTGPYLSCGQSFTAGTSGVLNSIDVNLSTTNPVYPIIPGNFSLTLRDGDGVGGTVLGTENFNITGSESDNAYISIPISSGTINIISGNTYTFIITTSNGQIMLNATSDAYSGGQLYNNGSAFSGYDLLFKTYLSPCITNQSISAAQSSGCDSLSTSIDLASSETGVNYYLRHNVTDSIIDGPLAGTGGAISLNTGKIYDNTTYNVYATGGTVDNGSLIFNGNASQKYVDLGTNINDALAGTSLITVEAWVYPSDISGLQTVVSNYDNSTRQFLLRIDNGIPYFFVNPVGNYASSASLISVNTWTHLAGTWDGSTIKIYVNGVLQGTSPLSGVFPSCTNIAKIGGGLSNGSEFFTGSIADVNIWSDARTVSQINNDKNYCLSGMEANLLALYNMTDGTGSSILTDATVNANNGTLTNMNPATDWGTGVPSITCYSCNLQMSNLVTLSVNHSNTGDTTVAACDNFTWYGTDYTSSATPTHVFTNMTGCDSTVTLHLTINNSNTGDTTVAACDNFTWYGTDYTSSATPTHVFTNMTGCDSTVTLHLTINNSNTGDTTVAACDNFTWYGTDYTSSATPTHVFTNMTGCDSTVTLHLTINNSNTGDTTVAACDNFTWYGTDYTSSATPTHVFTNMTGCDSTVTLHLTINTVDKSVTQNGVTLSANATGATYKWLDCNNAYTVISGETNQTFVASVNGSYAVEVTQNGCVDTSACYNVTTAGINSYIQSTYKLYPNPVNNELTIESQGNINQIEVYNLTGQLLQSVNPQSSVIKLNFSTYDQGVYLVKVHTTDGQVATSRVVKD